MKGILNCDHSNKSDLKTIISCGAVFIMFYRVVLAFKPVSEILKCDHLNESY